MERHNVLITRENMDRLKSLLESSGSLLAKDRRHLETLEQQLECAQVVATDQIPPDVVTINSCVTIRHLDDSRVHTYTLVLPGQANLAKGRISVLAPIGSALIGCRTGDFVDLEVPGGARRLCVEEILYQPEAARAVDRESGRRDRDEQCWAA